MKKKEVTRCLNCSEQYCPAPKANFLLCPKCEKFQAAYLIAKEEKVAFVPPDEIEPNLWLGPYSSAFNEAALATLNIKNILIVGNNMVPRFPKKFKYLQFMIKDNEEQEILTLLPKMVEFIENSLSQGEGVLVHCLGGISRSASVVIAYIIKSKQWKLEKALEFVKSKRGCIYPNSGFIRQLKEYEELILSNDA